jgi:hypothetical protein
MRWEMHERGRPGTLAFAGNSACRRENRWWSPELQKQDALFYLPCSGLKDGYSHAVSGFPPLLDTHYKLEADSKFCAVHAVAVNDARQRLYAFLWSGDQHVLRRSAVPVSYDTRPSRTHIFGDRPRTSSRFVQAQNLNGQCAFPTGQSVHASSTCPPRCPDRLLAELRPHKE